MYKDARTFNVIQKVTNDTTHKHKKLLTCVDLEVRKKYRVKSFSIANTSLPFVKMYILLCRSSRSARPAL